MGFASCAINKLIIALTLRCGLQAVVMAQHDDVLVGVRTDHVCKSCYMEIKKQHMR